MEGQKRIFEIIKTKISDQYRLADMMEELLGVSTDSAYRRIRGETELSFSELQKICARFNLSVDDVLSYKSSKSALFQYTPVSLSDQESYIGYMTRLLEGLKVLKSATEKELFFTAQDIPFYHFLKFPELAFFKLYAWNDTINHQSITFCKFCDHLEKDRIMSIYEEMHHAYMYIPSKEIWTGQTMDTILRLLEYYYETGAFEKKDTVLLLLGQLTNLLDAVKQYADDGYKEAEKETPFSLYICSVDLGNDFMLTKRGTHWSCNIKLYTINSMATENESLCSEMSKWIDDLISKSILISGASARERNRFYQSSKNKIDNLMNKIEMS